MNIRTVNNRFRKAHRRTVLKNALKFDLERFERLQASGRIDKRTDSGYVRRRHKKDKARTYIF